MRTYQTEKESVSELPTFALGEEVEASGNRGIIVELKMPSNGLYLSPERAEAVVWFGADNSAQIEGVSGRWGQFQFRLSELKKIL